MKWLLIFLAISAVSGCAHNPCDFNGDRASDKADYDAFQAAFGSAKGDPNYNPRADMNSDGWVNGLDFIAYATNCKQG